MKCSNCGRRMPDGVPYCDGCGAPLSDTALTLDPLSADNRDAKPKVIWPLWSKIAVSALSVCITVCCIFLGLRSVRAPIDYKGGNSSKQTASDLGFTVNDEYSKIFSKNGLSDRPACEVAAKHDYAAYAKALTAGYVDKWEFGYEANTVKVISRTFFFTHEYIAKLYQKDSVTRSEIDAFLENLVSDPSFGNENITVLRRIGTNSSTIYIRGDDLDIDDNYETVFGIGDYGIADLKAALIAQGYTPMIKE